MHIGCSRLRKVFTPLGFVNAFPTPPGFVNARRRMAHPALLRGLRPGGPAARRTKARSIRRLTIVDLRVGYPQPQADESRTGPQTKPQMKSRPGVRRPDPIRDAAIDCGSRVPRCGTRAGHSSTLTLHSGSNDADRRATSGRCADRRARNSASPNYNCGGIRPTARGASQSHIRLRQLSRRTAPPASRPAA